MFFKKKLAAFYKKALRESGENIKFLSQDMERYISRKQEEVMDYGKYLTGEYIRLVQKRIEEYEDAKIFYDRLCSIMLTFAECYFDYRILIKKKQEVFLSQRVCSARMDMISTCWAHYSATIGECNELLDMLEEAVDDEPYNYLILYQNQELMGIVEEEVQEKSNQVKYVKLQQSLLDDNNDKAAKSVWYYAKTVEEEMNLYKREIGQLHLVKKRLYGKIEDCKKAKEQIRQISGDLKQNMDELKSRQLALLERQRSIHKDVKKAWNDYLSKSDVCVEFDRQILENDRSIKQIDEEIEGKRQKISKKRDELNLIKNAQSNIKEKRERLKSLNQYDKNMHRGCIDEIRRVKEKRNSCFSVISDAKTRKKELCMEHKNLSNTVKEIKNSHSNDPWFNDKISRLNTLSAYIDKANNEIDTYKVYISAYDREKEEIQKRLDWYSSNLDGRNREIENYKSELAALSERYDETLKDIKLVYEEIAVLKRKKKTYYDKISFLKEQKQEYIRSRDNEFNELIHTSRTLLEE